MLLYRVQRVRVAEVRPKFDVTGLELFEYDGFFDAATVLTDHETKS
jgi:hypothetical protein